MRDEELDVLRDALVGVVGLLGHQLHAVVRAVGQPRPQVPVGEPAPPADLQHLAQVELVDGQHDEGAYQPRHPEQLLAEHLRIFFLQRAEEIVVPAVQQHAQVDHPERQPHHGQEQAQAGPAILGDPVGPDHPPGVGQGSPQTAYGGIGVGTIEEAGLGAFGILARRSAVHSGSMGTNDPRLIGRMLQLFRHRDHRTREW